jgi:sulfatase modifying factor 1
MFKYNKQRIYTMNYFKDFFKLTYLIFFIFALLCVSCKKNSDTLSAQFVLIKGGCFTMGSPKNETGREQDEQQKKVCVKDFYLAKTEITNKEYLKFKPDHKIIDYASFSLKEDSCPVAGVTWDQVQEYIAWLNKGSSVKYRLPTTEEWEYAARAGTTASRFWGDDPDKACLYANVSDKTAMATWKAEQIKHIPKNIARKMYHNCDDNFPVVAPVASFKPNAFGLYDMLGNVWEWVDSSEEPDKKLDEQKLKMPWKMKEVRGGGWNHGPVSVRCANRGILRSFETNMDIGFRLAYDVPEQAKP